MLKKLGILGTVFIVILSLAAASHVKVVSQDLTYSKSFGDNEIVLECDKAEGDCPVGPIDPTPEINLCGSYIESADLSSSVSGDIVTYTIIPEIPEDGACSPEEGTLVFENAGHAPTFKLNVEAENMDPHYGKYIMASMNENPNTGSKPVLRQFELTDDADGFNGALTASEGELMIREFNSLSSRNSLYNVEFGTPSGSNLESLGETGCTGDCDQTDPVFVENFGSTNFNYQPVTDTSHSGLHTGKSYNLDGEIIKSSFPDEADKNYGPSGERFFVCRPGATMNNGYEEIPQVVKGNPDEDYYYVCNYHRESGPGGVVQDTKVNEWVQKDADSNGLNMDSSTNCIDDSGSWYHTRFGGDAPDNSECDTNTGGSDCKRGAVEAPVTDTSLGATYDAIVAQYEESDGTCSTNETIYSTDGDVYTNWKSGLSNNYPRSFRCGSDPSYNLICQGLQSGDYTQSQLHVAEYIAEDRYFDQKLELSPQKTGVENYKEMNFDDSQTLTFTSLNTDFWSARYEILPTVDETNSEVTVDISMEIKGSSIPGGLGADPTYKSATPTLTVEQSGTGDTTTLRGLEVKQYDDDSWEQINFESITFPYEEIRKNDIEIRSRGFKLYEERTPGTTSGWDDTDGAANAQSRSLSIKNYKQAVETEFVGPSGWQIGRQSLWEAEDEYSSGDEHQRSTWEPKNISFPGVYGDGDKTNNIDAWGISNAGARDSLAYSNPSSEGIFTGGFAAKCEDGYLWEYIESPNDEWRCSDNFDWDQIVNMPKSYDDDLVGLQISPLNFKTASELEAYEDANDFTFSPPIASFPQAVQGRESSLGSSIDTVNAECWQGALGDKSSAVPSEIVSHSFTPSSTEVTGFYANMDHSGTYSCEWEFVANNGEVYDTASSDTLVEMHNLRPIYNEGVPKYDIARDVRRNGPITYSGYGSFYDFQNEWPSLTEVPN